MAYLRQLKYRGRQVAKATTPPPANPLSDKKEIRRGEISEKGKGAAGGARPPLGGQAARLRLATF